MTSKVDARSALAGRLREARKLAGLSQGHVAGILGLHRPSISEIELATDGSLPRNYQNLPRYMTLALRGCLANKKTLSPLRIRGFSLLHGNSAS